MQDSEKLCDIESAVGAGAGAAMASSKDSNETVFDFGDKKSALVFEEAADATEPDPQDADPDLIEETASIEETSGKTGISENSDDLCENNSTETEEFQIPDGLDGVIRSDFVNRTYVPRFTEVTEKRYRFVDEKPYKKPTTVTGSRATCESDGDITPVFRQDKNYSTAELDDDRRVTDAVVVEASGEAQIPDGVEEGVAVFKFDSNAEQIKETESGSLEDSETDSTVMEEAEFTPEDEKDSLRDGDIEDITPEWGDVLPEEQMIARLEKETDHLSEIAAPEESLPPQERPDGAGEELNFAKGAKKGEGYFSRRESFKDKFLDKIMATRLRLIVLAVLGGATLLLENPLIPYYATHTSNIKSFSFTCGVFEICIVAAMLLLVLPEIVRGIMDLRQRIFAPELSLILSALAIIGYTVTVTYGPYFTARYMGSVFFIAALPAVYSTLCMYNAEYSCFKVISEKGTRSCVDTRQTRLLERENIALDGAVNEISSVTARDFKTTYISKFFKNSSQRRENSGNNIAIILVSLCAAVLTGLVVYFFYGNNLPEGIMSATYVISLGIPSFFIVSHKYSHKKLQDALFDEKSCIVSEKFSFDCEPVDVIAFEDTEVFSQEDVVFKGVTLCDRSGDFHRVMKKMTSLFAALGGPLAKVFEASINRSCAPAKDVVIEDDGVMGYVDGAKVMAGSAEYMQRHGIRVPEDRSGAITSTKTMYGADGRIVFAKFNIQYSFSEEFAFMLQEFDREGIIPLIYTRDPNVNNQLVAFLSGGRSKVRVMRKLSTVTQQQVVYKSLSSGIVSFGGKTGTVNAILKAKRYVRLHSTLSTLELVSSMVGAVLAVGLSLFLSKLFIYPLAVVVWQSVLWIAMAVISKKTIQSDKKVKKEKND